jgi:hypothetical protein
MCELMQSQWFQTDWPISPEFHSVHCAHREDWLRTQSQYPYSSSVSFELPVSSAVLFFLARGSLASGNIKILHINQVSDVAKVQVDVGYYRADAIDRAHVCALTRSADDHGVGIFVGATTLVVVVHN